MGRALTQWFEKRKSHVPMLRTLLLKLLVKSRGLSGLSKISHNRFIKKNSREFGWFCDLLAPFSSDANKIHDRLNPFKDLKGYRSFEKAFAKVELTGEGMEEFNTILKRDTSSHDKKLVYFPQTFPGLFCFFYRTALNTELPRVLSEWLSESSSNLGDKNHHLLSCMIRSMQQGSSLLAVDRKSDDDDLATSRIAAHVLVAAMDPGSCGLKQFLFKCIFHPEELRGSWFPCMANDVEAEVARLFGNELGFYRCPNGLHYFPNLSSFVTRSSFSGHMYGIGNCKRAWVEGKCADCGAKIGGTGHQLLSSNADIKSGPSDRSPSGYCASTRSSEITLTYRQMKPENFRFLRLLMHCALSLSSFLFVGEDSWYESILQACNREYLQASKPADLVEYFENQAREDWKVLKRLATAGTRVDPTTLQCRIHAFLENHPSHSSHKEGTFPTLALRNKFEQIFQGHTDLLFAQSSQNVTTCENDRMLFERFLQNADRNMDLGSVLASPVRQPLWRPRKPRFSTSVMEMELQKWYVSN